MENFFLFPFYVVLKVIYSFITIEKGQVIIQNTIVNNLIMASFKIDDTFTDANKWTCQKCTLLNSISVYPKCILCNQSDSLLMDTSPVI